MSYILDALNKADKAARDKRPGRLDQTRAAPGKVSRFAWLAAVLALVLLNVSALWYFTRDEPTQVAMPLYDAAPPAPATTAPEQAIQPSQAAQPSATPHTGTTRVAELPISVQRQIPDLRFASHIHATDPSLRMVSINGRIYYEGDMIADGLRLITITERGVALSFLQYSFEIPATRDWSFD